MAPSISADWSLSTQPSKLGAFQMRQGCDGDRLWNPPLPSQHLEPKGGNQPERGQWRYSVPRTIYLLVRSRLVVDVKFEEAETPRDTKPAGLASHTNISDGGADLPGASLIQLSTPSTPLLKAGRRTTPECYVV